MAAKQRIIPPLTPQDILRFWSKVRVRGPNECWPWIASGLPHGYGTIACGSRTDHSRRHFLAHRVAWNLANGPVQKNLCVLHHCDNPPCCNPRHLFLGTQADNNRDMIQKGRYGHTGARGARNGRAKVTEEDVRNIRRKYSECGISHYALARQWGIGASTVWHIIRRDTWAHVGSS